VHRGNAPVLRSHHCSRQSRSSGFGERRWRSAWLPATLILVCPMLFWSWALWWRRSAGLPSARLRGRHIYAIGRNAEAARRAGIPVAAVRVGVFALIGMLAGLGGVLSASRQFAVSIGTGGGTLLLDAIAAAVIGGTSLFGGRGRIYHAILGALVIGSVANGLDLLGPPPARRISPPASSLSSLWGSTL